MKKISPRPKAKTISMKDNMMGRGTYDERESDAKLVSRSPFFPANKKRKKK